jgi:hypothetical protein
MAAGSGGARMRSGPAPDPNALRRDRSDDAGWITLPADGYKGDVPEFPLPAISIYDIYWVDKERIKEFDADATEALHEREVALWETLWRKPQAAMWAELGLDYEVAAYVRGYIESTSAESNAGLKTAVLRMAAEIGLSLPGMHGLRWKIATSVGATTSAPAARKATSSRARLKAVPNVGSG